MNELPEKPNLKEINAYKKKLTWGDVSAIYHMVYSSIGELDGILTHGFDSAYKRILNRNTWNLSLLQGYKDDAGNIQVKNKAKIHLTHVLSETGYELHCSPIVHGKEINKPMLMDPHCPFENWQPESMGMLFRINSLIPFTIFAVQHGDEADLALIKYAYYRVEELIEILSESFHIVAVKGYSIAEFYQEVYKRNGDVIDSDVLQS